MEKEGRERERCGTALTFIALVNSVEYQWTQPQLRQNGIESSSCFPYHTRPFSSQLKKLHPSISTRLHRYRLDPLKYGSRYDRYLFARYIYIYLFYLLFVLPPPTRSTNLTRIFFASSLERTEGGLTRGRKRMEDKQRMVIDGWERLEGGGGNFSWFEIEVTLRVLHRGYNSA